MTEDRTGIRRTLGGTPREDVVFNPDTGDLEYRVESRATSPSPRTGGTYTPAPAGPSGSSGGGYTRRGTSGRSWDVEIPSLGGVFSGIGDALRGLGGMIGGIFERGREQIEGLAPGPRSKDKKKAREPRPEPGGSREPQERPSRQYALTVILESELPEIESSVPISGANIIAMPINPLRRIIQFTDNGGGEYSGQLRLGAGYRLRISHPAYKPLTKGIREREGEEHDETLNLEPILGKLELTVRDEAGYVYDKLEIELVRQGEEDIVYKGETDEDGVVEFEDVLIGGYSAKVTNKKLPDLLEEEQNPSDPITVSSGDNQAGYILQVRRMQASGRILDIYGNAVSGLELVFKQQIEDEDKKGGLEIAVTTNRKGHFSASLPIGDSYELLLGSTGIYSVSAPGEDPEALLENIDLGYDEENEEEEEEEENIALGDIQVHYRGKITGTLTGQELPELLEMMIQRGRGRVRLGLKPHEREIPFERELPLGMYTLVFGLPLGYEPIDAFEVEVNGQVDVGQINCHKYTPRSVRCGLLLVREETTTESNGQQVVNTRLVLHGADPSTQEALANTGRYHGYQPSSIGPQDYLLLFLQGADALHLIGYATGDIFEWKQTSTDEALCGAIEERQTGTGPDRVLTLNTTLIYVLDSGEVENIPEEDIPTALWGLIGRNPHELKPGLYRQALPSNHLIYEMKRGKLSDIYLPAGGGYIRFKPANTVEGTVEICKADSCFPNTNIAGIS
ncbi:hypothetical protein JW930_01625 [Candidatus Woesearchaeota archaeon]|nr:hypothetical protein [Candidatus Woesearchaeota archaeon]